MDFINLAIHKNYMLWILVTSGAEGKISSMGWDFGAGKSTLALQYMNTTCYAGNWNRTKANTLYAYWQIKQVLDRPQPTNAVLIDDMPLTLGKHQQHNKEIQELAYYLTTVRPYVHVWFATASDRDKIQKDFREMFHFEIIVVRRGRYEIQQLKKWLNFRRPQKVRETLRYDCDGYFPSLSPDIQTWYDKWRHKGNVEIRNKLKAFSGKVDGELQLNHLSESEKRIVDRLAQKGFVRYETLHKENKAHIAMRLKRKGWLEMDGGRRYVLTELAEDVIYKGEEAG